jgi:outer membrane beta-barrel protein
VKLFGVFFLTCFFCVHSVTAAERLDVDSLKKKYWETGSGDNLRVVQNRTYTKANRLNLGLLGGALNNDPFLNAYSYGAKVGYDFTEYFGINFSYLLGTFSYGAAYDALVTAQGYGSNSNPISAIYGAEVLWSLLYGKVSVIGLSIIHFDMYLCGGLGLISAKNGKNLAPWVGIGQQAFLNRWMSLSATYRVYRYVENVVELNRPGLVGSVIGNRTTYAGSVILGLNFFIF